MADTATPEPQGPKREFLAAREDLYEAYDQLLKASDGQVDARNAYLMALSALEAVQMMTALLVGMKVIERDQFELPLAGRFRKIARELRQAAFRATIAQAARPRG